MNKVSRLNDDRGAMMIAGVFMMLIVVSLIYVLIGVARTLLAREGMQDAADASVLAGAIFMARGMNLITMINILMALLVAILVAIRLAQTFFKMAAISLYAFVWYFGLTSPAAAACDNIAMNLGNAYTQAKDVIFEALEVMHQVQEGVSVITPFIAVGAGALEAAQNHAPAYGAFTLPAPQSLPVESDEFPVLCGRATDMAITGSMKTFETVFTAGLDLPDSLTKPIYGPVEAASQKIGQSLSQYLCGDGKGSVPSYEHKYEKSLPENEATKDACEEPTSQECLLAEQDLEFAEPDSRTGDCLTHCGYDDPYETRAREARRVCEPKSGRSLESFTWQEVLVTAVFTRQSGKWEETDRKNEQLSLETEDQPPCGRGGSINPDEWNNDSGPRRQVNPNPLCKEEPDLTGPRPREGATKEVEYKEVRRLFSCISNESQDIALAEEGDSFGGEGSDDKSPHKLEEGVVLGSETFQLRSLAFGPEVGPGSALDGVRVSLLGREESDFSLGLGSLNQINRFSFAQAEYYYDHDQRDYAADPKDWLWEMRWTARLRRVRLPSQDEKQQEEDRQANSAAETADKVSRFGGNAMETTLEDSCSMITDSCPTEDDIDLFASLIIH